MAPVGSAASLPAKAGCPAVLGLFLISCSGGEAEAPRPSNEGCSKDTDCRAPRICRASACVDPAPAVDASLAAKPVAGAPGFAMFGGDARHTGRRPGPVPAKQPKELWKVPVGIVACAEIEWEERNAKTTSNALADRPLRAQ